MDAQFQDRILLCSDCHGEFIFTAGEQLFFHDKQFKNDPKRCKPCKSRRSGLAAVANGTEPAAAGLSRTETRTECSECGVQTTVPFKPTQGRPVLCRHCFQLKNKAAKPAIPVPSALEPAPVLATDAAPPALAPSAVAPLALPPAAPSAAQTIAALTDASLNGSGAVLSPDAAVLAATSMAAATPASSVSTLADLQSITASETKAALPHPVPTTLVAAAKGAGTAERLLSSEAVEV